MLVNNQNNLHKTTFVVIIKFMIYHKKNLSDFG
jgi:hypothetical protein